MVTADALSSLDGVFTFLFGPVTIDDAFHILLIVTMVTPWLCGWAVVAELEEGKWPRDWTMISMGIVGAALAFEAYQAFEEGLYEQYEWHLLASVPIAIEAVFHLLSSSRTDDAGRPLPGLYLVNVLVWTVVVLVLWELWFVFDEDPTPAFEKIEATLQVIAIFETARASGAVLALAEVLFRGRRGPPTVEPAVLDKQVGSAPDADDDS